MSEENQHITAPDRGVVSTDLFIYDSTQPGTGGLVSVVLPDRLEARQVTLVETESLRITFELDRGGNTGRIQLSQVGTEEAADRKTFRLTAEFLTQEKVSLTVLFNNWKIVALIDGEPLYITNSN